MAALDCLTRAGLSGLLDCSSQAVKQQNCPQPRSPRGCGALSSLLGNAFCPPQLCGGASG